MTKRGPCPLCKSDAWKAMAFQTTEGAKAYFECTNCGIPIRVRVPEEIEYWEVLSGRRKPSVPESAFFQMDPEMLKRAFEAKKALENEKK